MRDLHLQLRQDLLTYLYPRFEQQQEVRAVLFFASLDGFTVLAQPTVDGFKVFAGVEGSFAKVFEEALDSINMQEGLWSYF